MPRTLYSMTDTPFGPLMLVVNESGGVMRVDFGSSPPKDAQHSPSATREVARQLTEYFTRERRAFDFPLAPVGTPYQQRVWAELLKIPFGETRSYAAIAAAMRPRSVPRAVGLANGANPIAIIIPCHRVIGADGSLTGYGGGLPIKQRLLEFEGALGPALFKSHERDTSPRAALAH